MYPLKRDELHLKSLYLGLALNVFLLFIAITFVAFLFFKLKLEELDKILGRESPLG